jgi:hypothetical protein
MNLLRSDIDAALVNVAKKHRITLKTGHCTFSPAAANFTFKLEGVAEGGVDRKGELYLSLRRMRPTLPPLHSTFVYEEDTYEIIGANNTRTKVIAKCGERQVQIRPVDVEHLCLK